jgi:DNA-binding SARP family transcriptional activator/tetratricopeptide (TPR) repeat protein
VLGALNSTIPRRFEPPVVLHTLGAPLLLTSTGEKIRFRTRKHFALLIRLAVDSGQSLTRDYLMDLLWSDVPPRLARHSLSQGLSSVRDKVGREHFVIADDRVTLAAGAVDTDVQHLKLGDVPIRGRFLDGFDVSTAPSFGQWKDAWRAKLLPQIRECLVRRIEAGRRTGDFAEVEKHAQALHDLDPLCEDAVRGLIEARAWAGDRRGALQAFTRFQWDLSLELGVEPSPHLVRMADLLGQRYATPLAQSPTRNERRFEAEPLIGREREFTKLYDAWLDVRRQRPRIFVVTGDPGIGKTTLTNAFVSTCQMEGAVVARAQAYEAERELPFAVLAELIRQLTLQRAIGAVDPEALGELSRVCPEIVAAFPGAPKPVEWSAGVIPLRLADAFLKAVEAATQDCPLVLVVDDIHAADNASAAILHVVARKLPGIRLLLILVGRTNELRTAVGPSALVSDTTVQALQTLDLEQLPPGAAAQLIAAVAAQSRGRVDEVPSARILQAGNGNPLALELLTKEWAAHGSSSLLSDIEALNTQPVSQLGVPRAIAVVFDRQISRLDATTRTTLGLAAVLGRRLADLPLYEVIGLAPPTAGEALSRLREEGFLREVHGALEFRNELIRAQAYYAVAAPARRHLHRKVGESLARGQEEGQPSFNLEIAWHFLRGGDPASALSSVLEEADAAMAMGAPSEAEQILVALTRDPSVQASLQQLRLLLAKALVHQSKAEAAGAVLGILSQDPKLPPRDVAETSRLRAGVEYLLNRERGARYCEAANHALKTARWTGDPDLVARALFEYARSGANAGDESRVAAALNEARTTAERCPQETLPILTYIEGYCQFFFYDLRASATAMERTLSLLDERTKPVEASLAYTGYGSCKHGLCEFGDASDLFLKALDLARRCGDDSRASIIASNLCATMKDHGDLPAAIEFGELSVTLGTRALSQPRLATAYFNLASASLLAGQRERALAHFEAAQKSRQGEQSWGATVEFFMWCASFGLLMRDPSLALEMIRRAERTAWNKERAVPNAGLFDKLRVYRVAQESGPEVAWSLANAAREKYRNRHLFYYLDAVACTAWIEKLTSGRYTEETERGLELFATVGAAGKLATLVAQGFLSGPGVLPPPTTDTPLSWRPAPKSKRGSPDWPAGATPEESPA